MTTNIIILTFPKFSKPFSFFGIFKIWMILRSFKVVWCILLKGGTIGYSHFECVLEAKYLKCHFTFWYISALRFARWKNPSCLFFCLKPSQDPVPRSKWHLREVNFYFSDPGAGGVWWQRQVNSHPFDSLIVTFLVLNVRLIVALFNIFIN